MMSMRDHANNILDTIENDLAATRKRKEMIVKAMEMLASAGFSDDILNPLHLELEKTKEEFAELMIHEMLVRDGMRKHHWLDD